MAHGIYYLVAGNVYRSLMGVLQRMYAVRTPVRGDLPVATRQTTDDLCCYQIVVHASVTLVQEEEHDKAWNEAIAKHRWRHRCKR